MYRWAVKRVMKRPSHLAREGRSFLVRLIIAKTFLVLSLGMDSHNH